MSNEYDKALTQLSAAIADLSKTISSDNPIESYERFDQQTLTLCQRLSEQLSFSEIRRLAMEREHLLYELIGPRALDTTI